MKLILKTIFIFSVLFLGGNFVDAQVSSSGPNPYAHLSPLSQAWNSLPVYITRGVTDPFVIDGFDPSDFGLLENPYQNLTPAEQISIINSDIDKIEDFLDDTVQRSIDSGNNPDSALIRYLDQRINELDYFNLLAQANIEEQSGNIQEAQRLRDQASTIQNENTNAINNNQQYVQSVLNNLAQDSARTCSLRPSKFSVDACIANIIDGFFSLILWLLSWLLWLVDTLFAKIIDITIVGFGDLLEDLNVVNIAWKVVRDVANIFFIFILLYLAISTALQTPGVDTRKVLVNIIIIALVINFSAVFTKVAIDASNITALTFYNLLGVEGKKPDISLYFRSALSWFENKEIIDGSGPAASANTKTATSQTLAALAKNSGMFILLVITAFTLLAASFLLLIRGISLIILIIVSPLAFLGYGFKPLSEIFNKWLDRLKCDVLFAPLFFFLLYLTFGLFDSIYGGGATSTGDYNNFASQIVMFLMLNGLMLGSIMIAQKVGCQMGGKAFNFVTNRSKQSLGAMSGFAGRNSLGFLASKAQKSQTLKNLAAKAPRTGWAASTIAQKVSGYGFGSGFGSDKKDGGLGYTQRTEQRQKRQAEQLKLLKDPKQRAEYLSNIQRKAITIRGKTLLSASNEDAKKQFGDLPDREKADMRINAIDNEDTELIEVLDSLQDTLKGEKKESADKEYEKQLRQYLKVATKDSTDKSGNKVKKGDQLTIAQQLDKFDEIGRVFAKNKNAPTLEETKKGKEIQKDIYSSLSDADKVAINEGTRSTLKDIISKDDSIQTDPTKTPQEKLDSETLRREAEIKLPETEKIIKELEEEYIKGRGETEQKFREEEEKLKKQTQKRALEESKRASKEVINNIFKNIPTTSVPSHTLNPTEITDLKKSIGKLNVGDVANLDNTILQNQFVIERLSRQALTKIIANTEHIETNTLKIIQDYVTNPANLTKLDDKTAPKAFD